MPAIWPSIRSIAAMSAMAAGTMIERVGRGAGRAAGGDAPVLRRRDGPAGELLGRGAGVLGAEVVGRLAAPLAVGHHPRQQVVEHHHDAAPS